MNAPGELRLTPFRAWAELAGAWGLAIAWPIFQGITSGPEGLTVVRADRLDVFLFTAALILIGPTLAWIVEMLASRVSARAGHVIHAAMLGFFFGLVIWQGIGGGSGGAAAWAIVIGSALLIAVFYLRRQFARTMAGIMAFATPAVAIAFWLSGPVSSEVLPQPAAPAGLTGNGTPVVMIVLDEFALATIEESPGQIAAAEFPNFAKLAKQGTWYANATAVSDVTLGAVPGLLAGRIEDSGRASPSFAHYPDNLFTRLASAGYQVDGNEFTTDLCPHDTCSERGFLKSRLSAMLIEGTAAGQPLPDGLGSDLEKPLMETAIELQPSQKVRSEAFLEGLDSGESRLSYIHLALPHIPWIYLPNGQNYLAPIAPGLGERAEPDNDQSWVGQPALVDSAFQRMSLQTAFADRQIGRVMARIKSQGNWDKVMFVVVADHGGGFVKDQGRRYLYPDNQGWVLPVPLFVKYPGQTEGRTVKRPVDSFDVLPSILEETGVQVPDGSQGTGLDRPVDPKAPVTALSASRGELTFSRAGLEAASAEAVRQRNEVFPEGSLYAMAGHRNLLGRSTASADGLKPLRATFDTPWPEAPVVAGLEQVPAYVTGRIDSPVRDRTNLAISLNGRVAGTMRSWSEEGDRRFAFTMPPGLFLTGENQVELFKIEYRPL